MQQAQPGAQPTGPSGGAVAETAAARRQHERGVKLLLYDDPHSEYCAKVKVALRAKGLAWTALPAKPCAGGGDAAAAAGFRGRAPLGKIPALLIVEPRAGADSQDAEAVLCESEVINEWLDEAFPQPPLMPHHPLQRAKARLVSRFHDLYLEPALRRLYPLMRPSPDAAAVSAAAAEFYSRLAQLEEILVRGGDGAESCAADDLPDGSGGAGAGGADGAGPAGATRHGGGYAVGGTLTLADCGYPALLHYADIIFPEIGLGPVDYARTPHVAAWRGVLLGDPHVQEVLGELAPAAQEWGGLEDGAAVSGV